MAKKTDAQKLSKQIQDKHAKENKAVERAVNTTVKAIENKARADQVFAGVLMKHRCPALYLQWTAERFWGLKLTENLPKIHKCYDKLVELGLTEKNPYNFNDGDDELFFIPNKTYNVIVHTMQNHNMLYVWFKGETHGFQKLHIRRFYDVYDPSADPWMKEDEKTFKRKVAKEGYKAAIIEAEGIASTWADDYKTNPHPERLSLDHYKKAGFEMKYGDGRDRGYIATLDVFACKVDNAVREHHLLNLIDDCFIPHWLSELFDEEGVRC